VSPEDFAPRREDLNFTLPHHSWWIPGSFLKSWWIPSLFLPFLPIPRSPGIVLICPGPFLVHSHAIPDSIPHQE
jgi:hypothetical protein